MRQIKQWHIQNKRKKYDKTKPMPPSLPKAFQQYQIHTQRTHGQFFILSIQKVSSKFDNFHILSPNTTKSKLSTSPLYKLFDGTKHATIEKEK